MKIFLDDVRDTPEGYVRCYWPEEVIELLKTHPVSELSLDHDLGDDEKGTGYDVLKWIEEEVYTNNFNPPKVIKVHSANPIAKQRMLSAIASIYSYWVQK